VDAVVKNMSFLRSVATAAVVAMWLASLILPPVLLSRIRADWLAQLDRPEAQSNWDTFRRDMRQQSDRSGPVQRKVPKSAEPPARVWLRDYFRLAVVAWLLFVGVLGGFFCLLVAGVLRGATDRLSIGPTGANPSSTLLSEDQPRRHDNSDKQHERDAENTQERKHG
jgi:hypothetical protein